VRAVAPRPCKWCDARPHVRAACAHACAVQVRPSTTTMGCPRTEGRRTRVPRGGRWTRYARGAAAAAAAAATAHCPPTSAFLSHQGPRQPVHHAAHGGGDVSSAHGAWNYVLVCSSTFCEVVEHARYTAPLSRVFAVFNQWPCTLCSRVPSLSSDWVQRWSRANKQTTKAARRQLAKVLTLALRPLPLEPASHAFARRHSFPFRTIAGPGGAQ